MINQQIPEANSFFESADTIQTPASQADTPVFYNKPQDVLFTAPFSSEIKGKFGADPITAKWALVFEEQELEAFPITIISKDGQILQYQLGQFVSVDQVAEITVSGQKYTLLPDAWGNPSFYQEAEERPKLTDAFKKTVEAAYRLWEAAIAGEDEIKALIVEMFDPETLEIVEGLLSSLEEYPEILENQFLFGKIDLWDITRRGKTIQGAVALFKEENVPEYPPYGSEKVFKRCEELLEKIITHRILEDKDRYFIDALKISRIAERKRLHDYATHAINPFTRPYAMASLLENLLCKEFVGAEVFDMHRTSFDQFTAMMTKAGYEMPSWFSSYQGNEFVWGFGVGSRVVANSAGEFFINSDFGPEETARVLDHERIHAIVYTISSETTTRLANRLIEGDALNIENDSYDEAFTETLALLIRNKGDIAKAILENQHGNRGYKNGVNQLLLILQRINEHSADPLLGAKLMIDGLKGLARGETLSRTASVKKYYDTQVADAGTFDKEMNPYQDMYILHETTDEREEETKAPPVNELVRVAEEVVSGLSNATLLEAEKEELSRGFSSIQELKTSALNIISTEPSSLLDNGNSIVERRILRAILEDEAAKEQLGQIQRLYYEKYLSDLKRLFDIARK